MTHCVADIKMREAGTAEPVLPPPIVKSKAARLHLSRPQLPPPPSQFLFFCLKSGINPQVSQSQ
jgi:hypothetical protein